MEWGNFNSVCDVVKVSPDVLFEVDHPLLHPYSVEPTKRRIPEVLSRGPLSFFNHGDRLYFALGDNGLLHPVRDNGLICYPAPDEMVFNVMPTLDWAVPYAPITEEVLRGVFYDAFIYTSPSRLDMGKVVQLGIGPNQHLYQKTVLCLHALGLLKENN